MSASCDERPLSGRPRYDIDAALARLSYPSHGDWVWPSEEEATASLSHPPAVNRAPLLSSLYVQSNEELLSLSSQTCAICLDYFSLSSVVTVAPCPGHHVFHRACIEDWLSALRTRGRLMNCPMCRGVLALPSTPSLPLSSASSNLSSAASLREEAERAAEPFEL